MIDDLDFDIHFESDRIEKISELRDRNGNAYANDVQRDFSIGTFIDKYGDRDEFSDASERTLAGRVTRVNDIGSVLFADVEDRTGRLQLVFSKENTPDPDDWGLIDVGDYVEVIGEPTRTDTNELSLLVEEWRIITKSLRSIPDRTGFNERNRVRNRVGALLVDESLRDSVETRFAVMASLRERLREREFREVETPVLQNAVNGANASRFRTYCEALDEEKVLRIAPELYLKRLVMAGFERVFELGKCFRNEDIDTTHSPEFTMLELYEAFADYEDVMDLTEDLISSIIREFTGSYELEYDGVRFDFEPPWPRMAFERTIEVYGDIPVTDLSDAELRTIAEDEYGIEFDGEFDRGSAYVELYDETIEREIDGPLFVVDHPRESTPLCAPHRENKFRVERFEVVVAGMELVNAYSELTDPISQAEAFVEQAVRCENDQGRMYNMDTEFVEALGYGLPPTGGVGIGVDRLSMLVSDSQSIKEVLPFPLVATSSTRG